MSDIFFSRADWLFAAAFISSLVGTAGLYVAIASQRSQLALQTMLQYSEKFRMMLLVMPVEFLAACRRPFESAEPSPELRRHALSLFYVLLELNHLREKRYLPMGIWNLWPPSLHNCTSKPSLGA